MHRVKYPRTNCLNEILYGAVLSMILQIHFTSQQAQNNSEVREYFPNASLKQHIDMWASVYVMCKSKFTSFVQIEIRKPHAELMKTSTCRIGENLTSDGAGILQDNYTEKER